MIPARDSVGSLSEDGHVDIVRCYYDSRGGAQVIMKVYNGRITTGSVVFAAKEAER